MTDIIYLVSDNYQNEQLDTFEFLQENSAMLGKRNENRKLYLFKVNSQGKIIPENEKVQQLFNSVGAANLPLALALKKGTLFTANELSALFEGVDIQEDDESEEDIDEDQ